ncbi:MAG TPA: EAL domain-containing protein, partial [Lachnospiraceae bacterium]|nr:EAL domain-containing protein [Lachnospiraceae bacterium]
MDSLISHRKRNVSVCCIILLIFVVDFIVYLAGGTEYAFTHLMYIPIIISAFLFNMKGAVGAAILGGITLGPLMPVNVSEGVMQRSSSWIFRGFIFIVIGLVVGFLFQRIKIDKEIQIKKSFTNTATGFPNASKLKIDLIEMANEQKCCSLIAFRIINLDDINMYVDYGIGEKALFKAIETLSNLVEKVNVYSVLTNEFAVTMWGCSIEDAYLKAKEFLDYFKEPVLIDAVPVNIVIKCGIINYPMHAKDGNDLYKKMSRTLDQQEIDEHRITFYEESLLQKNKLKYETIVLLYDAIKNGRFTIAYQPIINLKRNEVKGVEALLRWNNSMNMNTGEFIQIAEDAGLISEITKWVITNVIDQIKKWQNEGLRTKVAVNISSNDLKDGSIIKY